MQIDFDDRTGSVPANSIDMLQELLLFIAKKESIPENAEVSVNFVNNKEIQELNSLYRQQDKITDVISFALQDLVEGEILIKEEDTIGVSIPLALGDVVISIDKAIEQASEYNHSLERELGFLAVHGLLHLLGYDHMNEVDEKKMFKKQTDLLEEFGLER